MKRRDFCKSPALIAAAIGAPAAAQSLPAQFQTVPGLTRSVCRFILETHWEDVPPEVMLLGKKSILDGLGLALAGSVSSLAALMKSYVASLECTAGSAAIIGTGLKAAPRFAALANGTFIHADDYDDTQLAVARDRVYGLLTHPTVTVLPPALAMCQALSLSGRDLLVAYQVGVEVECKVAEAVWPRHYNDGFHTTGTVGVFGSGAACARLRGLDLARTEMTLGIAAAQSGGLRENFGSMSKPFHAGHAAEAGVVAADLAALGWTAAPNILEAQYGWFHANGGGFDADAIAGRLGKPWTLASPGVSIKPHPSGSLTHPAMGEMLRLIRRYDIQPQDVERVQVGGNSRMVSTLLHHRPVSGLQAKFSMEFGMAILLLERQANLAQYTDAVVQRPDVQQMIQRVSFVVDAEAEQAGFDKMTSIVSVTLKDGRTVSGRAQFGKGSPADPMSVQEVADKFRGCAEFARWPRAKSEAIIDCVQALEQEADLRRLSALLSV